MVNSMTSFAAQTGQFGPYEWTWDMRGVNARGLDIRQRVPDWIVGLEQEVKARTSSKFSRGSIQMSLKLTRVASESELTVNQEALIRWVAAIQAVEALATDKKLTLNRVTALDLLTQKGVQEATLEVENPDELKAVILTDLDALLTAFAKMRAVEGKSLHKVMSDQMDTIEALTQAAAKEAEIRKGAVAQTLKENMARVLSNAEGVDPDRIAQELALLAVKADVTEEIDRLHAHVSAARALLASDEPIGRKLDFLSQEFNREANTLCSKAHAVALTRIGLDLKAVIDQMREQVQNVE